MKKKKILLRNSAISTGKTVYYTGKPCKNGHVVQRYTSNGACLECVRIARLAERQAIKTGREQVRHDS